VAPHVARSAAEVRSGLLGGFRIKCAASRINVQAAIYVQSPVHKALPFKWPVPKYKKDCPKTDSPTNPGYCINYKCNGKPKEYDRSERNTPRGRRLPADRSAEGDHVKIAICRPNASVAEIGAD
jgi:hypothetical protein